MSPNASVDAAPFHCHNSRVNILVQISIVIKISVLLPLCSFILFLGHQQWRRSSKLMSHSDVFTFHMVVMELFWVLGMVFYLWGFFSDLPDVVMAGVCLSSTSFYGESLLHLVTCVERYLAGVHPITYRGLRNARGARIRNVVVGCVWALWFGGMILKTLPVISLVTIVCFATFSIAVICFCSLSVLCVLIGPMSVAGDRNRERVDQSKRRAFNTILVIMVILGFWFVGLLVSKVISQPAASDCVLVIFANCFNLPNSLVLPLLYLHRAGKLPCCR